MSTQRMAETSSRQERTDSERPTVEWLGLTGADCYPRRHRLRDGIVSPQL